MTHGELDILRRRVCVVPAQKFIVFPTVVSMIALRVILAQGPTLPSLARMDTTKGYFKLQRHTLIRHHWYYYTVVTQTPRLVVF